MRELRENIIMDYLFLASLLSHSSSAGNYRTETGMLPWVNAIVSFVREVLQAAFISSLPVPHDDMTVKANVRI